MPSTEQGDISLFQTLDDGEITVEEGIFLTGDGLGTAVYLSLFGGNVEDDGFSENSNQWWANVANDPPSKQYRSRTQHLLISLSMTLGNLKRVQDAVIKDLDWMLDEKIASSISAVVVVEDANRISISVSINAEGDVSEFRYVTNWKAALS